jgi:glutathione S-transferase
MKLFFSPASPYARKVMIVAHETGQAGSIELVTAKVSPVERNGAVADANPLGKLPALVTGDGRALFDSRVICQYLDSRHPGARLYPAEGPARWDALRLEALADGVLDAALLVRYETVLRPADKQWKDWASGQMAKIIAGLDAMEREVPGRTGIDAGLVAAGAALGYLDFRFPDFKWRESRPRLAAWFARFGERPSMQATAPKG